jgi:hypothetical protein
MTFFRHIEEDHMDFEGAGVPLGPAGLDRVCTTLGVTAVEVWAVLTVETRGFGFLPQRRPLILFERHIFHDRTGGRFDSVDAGISSSKPGGYVGDFGEYARLERAIGLDRRAALESASWGLGQVMGFNHQIAGFSTVDDMIAAMVKDETSQLVAMANFIKHNRLDEALRRQDWKAFARGYNGPAFAKNKYDTRLAAAHAKHNIMLPDLGLRSTQAALVYTGFDPGPVDGVAGRRTRAALLAFQEKHGLPETGERDAQTEARLTLEAFGAAALARG